MSRATLFQRTGFILLAAALALAIGNAASSANIANAQVTGPTATPSILQLPTATPTILGGPTSTPSRTPSIAPVIAQALGHVNLRSGPGTNTDPVGSLEAGDTVPVIGRSNQYPWYMVAWKDGPNGQAWVYKDLVTIVGDITTVPIIEPPPPPTIEPTQAALLQTATITFQTPGAAETATAVSVLQPTGITTVTTDPSSLASAFIPTFTQPAEIPKGGAIATGTTTTPNKSGIPPAVVIIGLGATGLLFLGLGLLRRAF